MEHQYEHRVLIVDDEEQVGKAIARLLKKMGIEFSYAPRAEIGLKKIETAEKPFSLVLSDQRMPGMKGHEFLEKVREISPDTIRFLITGYSDMDAIIDAVNRGAIHRYISKPWDIKEFMGAVKAGLQENELIRESARLFKLAKEQNSKLYKLTCELKEKAEVHKKNLEELDQEIDAVHKKIKAADSDAGQEKSLEKMEKILKDHGLLDPDKINGFYRDTIKELFEQFQDIAARNGFEMPEMI